MLNQIVIAGRLTNDAELRKSESGVYVCSMNIANNRKSGDKEETTFIEVVLFGNYAKAMSSHLLKSVAIDVVGKLVQDSWSSEDGKTHYKYKIIANDIGFRSYKSKKDDKDE
ncbi:MAG: single-stranded DNA-binding protein [Arcobacter butzleri]|jgi:single-strand DNA-binding protein|nr:single-stranded DNA-binding protein [Arcobacteraceae bacterium]NLO16667.1 single-stranded DNA-binding protein [Aliarcobacter butzleri]